MKMIDEVKTFCKNTSIAGLSRIINSKQIFLKVLWAFFLLACTGLLVYFIAMVFVEYYKWPVTTQFGENHKAKIEFPDITICSLNGVLNDQKIKLALNKYFNFFDGNWFTKDEDELASLKQMFNTLPSFLRNLPRTNILQKDCPDFIVECILYGIDWQKNDICTYNFTQFWNANYYSCYTLRSNQFNDANKTIRGMTLVLNDGPPSKDQISYDIFLGSSQGNGVRLAIHSPGTPPDLKRGITISPGTENNIKIVQTNIERLDEPYNPLGCTNQKHLTSPSENYSQDLCIEYCLQDQIYKELGCVSQSVSIPPSLSNVSLCGNMTNTVMFCHLLQDVYQTSCCEILGIDDNKTCECYDGFRFVDGDCAKESLEVFTNIFSDLIAKFHELILSQEGAKMDKDCVKACLIPCNEISYEYYSVTSTWPQNSMQLGIFQRYFEDCIDKFPEVQTRFDNYAYLVNWRKKAPIESENNYSLYDLKEIGESLMMVQLVIENDFPYMQVDKPQYTWDVLVGVVGGLLSLWLGVSAVAVAELFELVYFLIKNCF